MRIWRIVSGAFCLCLAMVTLLSSQEEIHETIDVTLVSIYMTAVDGSGRFVSDLKPDEITVKEDGNIQEVSHFGWGETDIPLSVAIVVDNSASMSSAYLDLAKKTGMLLVNGMNPEDSIFLVTFRRHPNILVDTTLQKNKIREALNAIQVQYGSTALFDAIQMAVTKLKPQLGRKVLILFSDGQDTVNPVRAPQDNPVSKFAGITDITTICFGTILSPPALEWYGAQKEYDQGKKVLENVAQVTGGFSFFPSNLSDAEKAIGVIRDALNNQYALAYQPSTPLTDDKWRSIEIFCKRKGLTLRYRKGYFPREPVEGSVVSSE